MGELHYGWDSDRNGGFAWTQTQESDTGSGTSYTTTYVPSTLGYENGERMSRWTIGSSDNGSGSSYAENSAPHDKGHAWWAESCGDPACWENPAVTQSRTQGPDPLDEILQAAADVVKCETWLGGNHDEA
ncbi:hypothetical protein [Streptantibioticus ferralitis]|uniref:Uncharacterized protein n=1 Tax=Streptantibioticus ferralitis TaxID=236510 RepID=A0ABT5ZCT4_9ACTN|nr:hypothetical protein [Streptantibioticus ferralitis]MDF2261652.1 hypothetical protein [Streptantibioticus ferralitis]